MRALHHDFLTGTAAEEAPLALAVIIPTFNEAANIEPMLQKLSIAMAGIHWEAIFVDDNSPDGTSDIVRQIALTNPRIRIVHRIGRRGLSSAVIEGMLASAAPVLAVIDGDGQHDEAILPQLFEAVASGRADIAVGTRYADGGGVGDWNAHRAKGSAIATRLSQTLLGVELSDPMSGYMVVTRKTIMAALPRLSGIGFKILLDIVASVPSSPRIAEIPYVFRNRELGESKAGALVVAEYAALLLDKSIGRYIPLRLLSFLAIGGLGVGVHLSLLGLSLWGDLSFIPAEIVAVIGAMTFNFALNNIFTYRDKRLRGWRMLSGLLSFYIVCSVGAAANIGIGNWVNDTDGRWWLAGIAGTVVGAIWNFAASSFVTWRK
jgi:dolichol-phosphate mannosyltransferase